jgi:dTDP-4-amino-4,6-dideoxygalactose transaminase
MSEIPFVDLKAQYQRLKPEIDARIHAVLEHGRFIMGPEVAELEEQLSAFVAGAHTISVSSGTDALLMALMADGVGPGDAVFLPAFTFTATAEVVVLLQAEPVFVDVERDTFNIDPDDLERRVEEVARTGRLRTRAVIPVDLFGLPANHERIAAIAGRHDLRVVDDAAQAMGASVGGRRIGTLAPLTATSFFPAKPLGGYGDGGAVFTTDDELAERLRSIRAHGKGAGKYDVVRIGINGRLDTLQAAVLLPKLAILDDELKARAELAAFYAEQLGDAVVVPQRPSGVTSAWAQYSIIVEEREPVLRALQEAGIPSAIYYPLPMHLQEAYRGFGAGPGSLPVSEYLSQHILSIPMHPYLDRPSAQKISAAVVQGARQA